MPRDPYRNFRFLVEIDRFVRAGFRNIEGLTHTVNVIDYREGGENETPRRIPGQSEFGEITCSRGVSQDNDFTSWIEEIFNLDNRDGVQPPVEGWRRTMHIWLRDKSGTKVKHWKVLNAWPSERSLEALDAMGNDVLIENLVIQNEGVKEINMAVPA